MATPFERLPFILDSEDLLDKAFSKASRAAGAKQGIDAQKSMTTTATNILHDNLENIVRQFPSFDQLPDFYREISYAAVDVDQVKQSLSSLDWASGKIKEVGRQASTDIGQAPSTQDAINRRKQAFARMSSLIEEVEEDLEFLGHARRKLVRIPEIDEHPTVVLAGYPNVGKSTFLERVTRASPEIEEYPFTTKGLGVGHIERDYIRYQVVDTPGLLDRPLEERNEMEMQSIKALELVADAIIFMLDPSEFCGYELEDQLRLRDEIREEFDVPMVVAANKSDLYEAAGVDPEEVDADYVMSLEEDENVDEVLEAAFDYLPEASELAEDFE